MPLKRPTSWPTASSIAVGAFLMAHWVYVIELDPGVVRRTFGPKFTGDADRFFVGETSREPAVRFEHKAGRLSSSIVRRWACGPGDAAGARTARRGDD